MAWIACKGLTSFRSSVKITQLDSLFKTKEQRLYHAVNSVRDLNKAYCAFSRVPEDNPDMPLQPVATGNW